jgi:hypothetical protein
MAGERIQTSVRSGLPAGFELLQHIDNYACLLIYFSFCIFVRMSIAELALENKNKK